MDSKKKEKKILLLLGKIKPKSPSNSCCRVCLSPSRSSDPVVSHDIKVTPTDSIARTAVSHDVTPRFYNFFF